MTEPYDETQLRTLARMLFGKTDDFRFENLGPTEHQAKSKHTVREGSNPDPGPIPDEAYVRQFVAHLFNRPEAFYEIPLPDPRSGE